MMISVLITVLKIIGIILISILSLIIFLLLLILLCPLRYRFKGIKDSPEIKDSRAYVTVSWLFPLIMLRVQYDHGVNFIVRVLALKVYDHQKKKAKANASNDNKSIDNEDFLDDFQDLDEFSNSKDSTDIDSNKNPVKSEAEKTSTDFFEESPKHDTEYINDDLDKNSNKESGKIKSKFKSLVNRVLYFFKELPDKLNTFIEQGHEKVDKIADTICYYDNLFSKKASWQVLDYIKKNLLSLLKSIAPRKGYINLKYGSDDPEKVAKVFEAFSIINVLFRSKNSLEVSYDEDILEFDLSFKGRVYIGYVALIALKLILNRRVKKFIKLIKREDKNGR